MLRTLPPSPKPMLMLVMAIAVALVGSGAADAQDSKKDPRLTWYAQAMARGNAGINVTHFWSLGGKFRAETVVAGHKIVTIVNGDTYYAFDGLGMNGVAIKRSPQAIAADAPDRRPFGNEVEMMELQGAEKVREEALMGRMCDVYQVTDKVGRRMLWATHDEFQLPVRIEIYDRARGSTKYTDFIDWTRGLPITDRFFEPDPAVQFERYELVDYVRKTAEEGPVGSVPVLYADLLHGRRQETK